MILVKAVGSSKAGKALALPDFPPSVHFYINACVPRRTDRCIKRHMRYYKDVTVFYALIMEFQEGDVPTRMFRTRINHGVSRRRCFHSDVPHQQVILLPKVLVWEEVDR